ncbi:MAG: hypothetical protein CFE22_04495 [Cytophagaceae bacterium BCCC1]|nr:MAG: hypothetical protein CFE22_04495 [Cytophagaceae bacterium BCCC1]
MKKLINIFVIALLGAGFASCEKADPFVARVVSPVLLLVQGSDGILSNGMTTEPTVPSLIAADANVALKVLELDKTGILDYKVGIDSLPVTGVKITFKLRTGTVLKEVSTDTKGVATLSTTWASLGITAPKAGSSVKLTATGIYKDVTFSKYFIISGK